MQKVNVFNRSNCGHPNVRSYDCDGNRLLSPCHTDDKKETKYQVNKFPYCKYCVDNGTRNVCKRYDGVVTNPSDHLEGVDYPAPERSIIVINIYNIK